MNILFTICGRAGSKGIKNKNIRLFLGYPLILYTLSAIDLYIKKHSEHMCVVALNTDSEEMIELTKKKYKTIEIVKRESKLAQDTTPKVTVIADTFNKISVKIQKVFSMVVDLDITSPLRTLHDIETLIKKKQTSNADVVFSVTDARRNPYFNMVKKTVSGFKRVIDSNFNTRQESPQIFDMNASLYAYSPNFLTSGKNIFDSYCETIHMVDTAVLDLDHEGDFELMQVIADYLYKKNEFNEIRENILNVGGEK